MLASGIVNILPDMLELNMKEGIVLDTHSYVKKLKAVGFTEEQAEALAELIDERLATKRDLKELETRLLSEIVKEAEKTKSDMVKWVAAMLAAQAAVVAALVKLL